jgi:hypothetical protein
MFALACTRRRPVEHVRGPNGLARQQHPKYLLTPSVAPSFHSPPRHPHNLTQSRTTRAVISSSLPLCFYLLFNSAHSLHDRPTPTCTTCVHALLHLLRNLTPSRTILFWGVFFVLFFSFSFCLLFLSSMDLSLDASASCLVGRSVVSRSPWHCCTAHSCLCSTSPRSGWTRCSEQRSGRTSVSSPLDLAARRS